ncbi:hypothetical protein HC766_07525 [Candidatus Gracilibacteria bacterium]|nr:hypothetical protein [Candidatus Gracilibacteria bacterium]
MFTLVLLVNGISASASTTSPFWDAGTSGTGYQNIYFNSGFVGIGKAPSNRLDVADNSIVSNTAYSGQYLFQGFDNTGGNNIGTFGVYKNSGVNQGWGKLSINGGNPGNGTGYVGLRLTNPLYPLDVNGEIHTNSNLFTDGKIVATDIGKAAGSRFLEVGDDTYMTDLDQANTLGIYGNQNSNQVRIKLGSNGGWLTSNNGEVCLGAC